MDKRKVLVHGTAESLKKFFSDASSHDFEVLAVLSEENLLTRLEAIAPKNLPKFVYELVDGIILTDNGIKLVNTFVKDGMEPRKIILWDSVNGWLPFILKDADNTRVSYFYGLEFHLHDAENEKFYKGILNRLRLARRNRNINQYNYPTVLAQRYKERTGKSFDFSNPQTFTEKLQWIKIYDATPIKSRLADKYLVRDWVADKIGQEYLIPLLGVWDDFDDIDFDELPDQFVLKCNHGSTMNIIVRDKKSFDMQRAREKINAWLATDFASLFLELHYTRIDRKIIAEKFMANGDLPDIDNYKFWCFNGSPLHCAVESGRSASGSLANLRIDFFDMNWKLTGFENGSYPNSEHPEKILPPKNFELMKKTAATLAEGFAFVRVDFYEIEGKVYFGEMTFTPGAGNFSYKSEGTDEYLGSLLKLPEPTPPPRLIDSIEYRVRQKFQSEIKFPPPPETIPNRKIIASLTSWIKRIGTAHLAIQTILNQTVRPDLTVLYLAGEEFPRREDDLPRELLNLRSDRFEIRWTKNIRSYKKLIPALKDFPDEIIITFDDDLLFSPELIERLLVGYKKYPEMIQCHRITNISFDEAGNVKISRIPYNRPTFLHKLTGCGSVLYPQHCLHEDVWREEKFMTLAPTSDDIWFWLMGVLNGRRVNVVENNIDTLNYIPGTQEVGLSRINDAGEKFFYKHLDNILKAYPVLREMLYYEQRLANGG